MTAIYDGVLLVRITGPKSGDAVIEPCCDGMARHSYGESPRVSAYNDGDGRWSICTIGLGGITHCPWCGAEARLAPREGEQ